MAPMALSAAIDHCTRRFQRRNAHLSGREGDRAADSPVATCGVSFLADMELPNRIYCRWLLPRRIGMQPWRTSLACMFLCARRRPVSEVFTERIAPANLRLR
jgi:hypothetical protein